MTRRLRRAITDPPTILFVLAGVIAVVSFALWLKARSIQREVEQARREHVELIDRGIGKAQHVLVLERKAASLEQEVARRKALVAQTPRPQ